MRREVIDWWSQAREDLQTAKLNIGIKRYYAAVFFAQQAGEKALKALYIQTRRRLPQRGHNMIQLSRILAAPQNVQNAAVELNPEYLVARYPNAAKGVPAQMYTGKMAVTHLKAAEDILRWVKRFLK